jgi:DNA-binding LacI/PurR family transcriptional regulator
MSDPRPTHRLIAAVCGVSTATVSRALAGHPHVRPDLRHRIEVAAQKLGYSSDPRLAYLSQLRWQRGRRPKSVTIAVLCDRFTMQGREKFVTLKRHAIALGYELERIQLEQAAMAGRNLGHELFYRGVRGLLINLHDPDVLPEIDWNRFSVVIVGEECPGLPFYRVATDWRQAFDVLCDYAWDANYRRVGICLTRYVGRELNRMILAEALLHREELAERGAALVPLFRFDAEDPRAPEAFATWCRKHRLECILANDKHPLTWCKALTGHIPQLLHLSLDDTLRKAGCAGTDHQLGARFGTALRLLHELMLSDRCGFAPQPTRTLYPVTASSVDSLGRRHRLS